MFTFKEYFKLSIFVFLSFLFLFVLAACLSLFGKAQSSLRTHPEGTSLCSDSQRQADAEILSCLDAVCCLCSHLLRHLLFSSLPYFVLFSLLSLSLSFLLSTLYILSIYSILLLFCYIPLFFSLLSSFPH